jgi:hypothetical protein
LRGANAYRIEPGFPRITERDLPAGVGDVRYSVAVTEALAWERSLAEVSVRLSEATRG